MWLQHAKVQHNQTIDGYVPILHIVYLFVKVINNLFMSYQQIKTANCIMCTTIQLQGNSLVSTSK